MPCRPPSGLPPPGKEYQVRSRPRLPILTCGAALFLTTACQIRSNDPADAGRASGPARSLAALARRADPKPSLTMHRVQAGERGEDGWYAARSTEGGFSVKLPNKYNDGTIHSKGKDGSGAGTLYMLSSVADQGCKLVALFAKDHRRVMEKFKKDLAAARDDKRIQVSTYKTRVAIASVTTMTGSDGTGVGMERRVLAPNGVLAMTVTCPIDRSEYARANARKFFDSLSWESD
jgi:hypothetical protein